MIDYRKGGEQVQKAWFDYKNTMPLGGATVTAFAAGWNAAKAQSPNLLVVTGDGKEVQFVVIIPEKQTQDQVKNKVLDLFNQIQDTDEWTYADVADALANEGFQTIGGDHLDGIQL